MLWSLVNKSTTCGISDSGRHTKGQRTRLIRIENRCPAGGQLVRRKSIPVRRPTQKAECSIRDQTSYLNGLNHQKGKRGPRSGFILRQPRLDETGKGARWRLPVCRSETRPTN